MPIGETIGAAYIRILADGTGFDDSVRRQVREHHDAFAAAGEKSSKAYWDGFDNENEKRGKQSLADLRKALARGTGRFDAIGTILGDDMMDGLEKALHARFGKIGTVMFADLKNQLESGQIDWPGLMSKLEDVRPLVAKATKTWEAELARFRREEEQGWDEWAKSIERRIKQQKNLFKELGAAIERLTSDVRGGGPPRARMVEWLRSIERILPRSVTRTSEFRKEMERLRGILGSAAPRFAAFRKEMEKSGQTIGRFFGRGSRNNFLNFFGGLVSGITVAVRALASFTKWPGLVAEQIQKMSARIQNAIDEFGSLGDALLNLASQGLPGLIAAVVAAVALIEGMFALLGAAGAAVSLLTGLILALAGSLGFALVGAIVAVGGALVPLAGAFGVVAIAMTNLDKKSKFFKTLKKDWQDLQKTVQTELFGKKQEGLENIHKLLKGIMPLIKPIATALGNLLDSMGKTAGTEAFKDAMKGIGDEIGRLLPILGRIGGNIGRFLGEAFRDAEPMITEFLHWLEGVTKKLADFGKKPKGGGKSGLAQWFEDAWTSAKKVGTLIENVLLVVGDLFGKGKTTGDSIIDKLAGAAENLHIWLTKPDNQKKIQQWFHDAELLADKLGDIVTQVVILLDKLDTPANRTILFALLETTSLLLQGLQKVAGAIDTVNSKATEFAQSGGGPKGFGGPNSAIGGLLAQFQQTDLWTKVLKPPGKEVLGPIGDRLRGFFASIPGMMANFGGAGSAINPIVTWIQQKFTEAKTALSEGWNQMWSGFNPMSAITQFFDSIDIGKAVSDMFNIDISGSITQFISQIRNPFVELYDSLVGHSIIPDLINEIISLFGTLPAGILGAIGNLASIFATWVGGVAGQVGTFIGQILAGFGGLAQKAWSRAGSLASGFVTWAAGVPAKAREVAGRVATGFAGLARSIIARAGNLAGQFATWLGTLPGKARSIAGQVVAGFGGLAQRAIRNAGSIVNSFASWVASLPGKARSIANQIASAFSGLAHKMIQRAGSLVSAMGSWAAGVYGRARGVADSIVSAFRGLAHRIVEAIGTIIPKVQMPNLSGIISSIQSQISSAIKRAGGASGFITTGPQFRLIGEAGPEAVVPLNRPLSQVDPAVRMLSAIAQGKIKMTGGQGTSKTIEVGGITINTPTEDPRAVASEVVAHMAAAAYF